MSDFDGFDDELANALQRRAGTAGSVAEAHEAVLTRSSTIRRRRFAVAGGGAMAVLLIGGFALLPRGADDTIGTADTGDVMPSVESTEPAPTSTSGERSIAPTTVDLVVPPPIDDSTTTTIPTTSSTTGSSTTTAGTITIAPPPTTGSTAGTPPTDSPATTTGGSPSTSSSTPTSTSPPSSTEAPTPPLEPFTDTYTSSGGSITVTWNGSSLHLDSVSPVGGFEAEIEANSSMRIRVRFRGDSDDSRIEVRVDDGELRVIIS